MLSVSSIFLFLLSANPPASQACVEAQNYYQNLDVEKAISTAAAAIALTEEPLPLCLEIQALSHIVMGQSTRGRTLLRRLFKHAPDYVIDDPSLSPSMRDVITTVRKETLNISSVITARWVSSDNLELRIEFTGRILPSHTVRYTARFPESGDVQRGEVKTVSKTATTTIVMLSAQAVNTLEINGLVRTSQGASVYQFSQSLKLGERPAPSVRKVATPEGKSDWHKKWWLWTSVGVLALAGGLGSYFAIEARNPDCPGGLGCFEVSD